MPIPVPKAVNQFGELVQLLTGFVQQNSSVITDSTGYAGYVRSLTVKKQQYAYAASPDNKAGPANAR